MTTTSPTWFPSWPTTFPDVQDAYELSVPRQYPEGLYEEGTDEWLDIKSQSIILSWVAQGSEWIQRRIFPQLDAGAMFLHLWEECLAVVQRATTADRQAAIVSSARNARGTATTEKIQNIFAPIFGIDPEDVAFEYATRADIETAAPDTNQGWAKCLNMLHIYDINETAVPDRDMAEDAIAICKPTWQLWSVGQYKRLKWGVTGAEGAWNQATWG